MPDRQPKPIAYATRATDAPPPADGSRVNWRAAVAAAWLVGSLLVTSRAVAETINEQWVAVTTVTDVPRAAPDAALMVLRLAWPTLFPLAFGAFVAGAQYSWSLRRLTWICLTPVVAAGWTAMQIIATPYQGSLPALAITVPIQCALLFAGTRLGRPVAGWLTRQLVPAPLRASLITLWL